MITNIDNLTKTIKQHGRTFAEVHNPVYVFPPVEYYPMAPPIKHVSRLKAALMDMDGTTTTTELLCIHALEMMLRQMSGKKDKSEWKGVDHSSDLQHIIGNSTTKHVEYLVDKYGEMIVEQELAASFIAAAADTLVNGTDEIRRQEVIQNIRKLNIPGLIDDILSRSEKNELIKKHANNISEPDYTTIVNLGIDIYYANYHHILSRIRQGASESIKNEILLHKSSSAKLIAPMPGIPLLIPLIKGWLGEEAGIFAEGLINEYIQNSNRQINASEEAAIRRNLIELGRKFEREPVKTALVTSSIFYEADIVISEVLKEMAAFINESKLGLKRKEHILRAYQDYHRVYDAFVTATDSSEIRLKPHRDLYSIALHRIGINPEDFDKVIGFEDSQSGTVAIRAAGIGCCVAVPFAETAAHNLEAATHILHGGIPQAIIEYGLFLE